MAQVEQLTDEEFDVIMYHMAKNRGRKPNVKGASVAQRGPLLDVSIA
jgi:hypothetical protein